jgi:hypothetical protein
MHPLIIKAIQYETCIGKITQIKDHEIVIEHDGVLLETVIDLFEHVRPDGLHTYEHNKMPELIVGMEIMFKLSFNHPNYHHIGGKHAPRRTINERVTIVRWWIARTNNKHE